MQATAIQERRLTAKSINDLWEPLTVAQKYAVAELLRYGYQLKFVRQAHSYQVAIMELAGKVAAINSDGQIDTAPQLLLRH